jgi:amidohydrolase
LGCHVEIELQTLTPAVVNDLQITETVYRKAAELFPDNQIDSSYRSMVSEDMAYLMQEIPGCYFFVGSSNPGKGLDAPHHHPCFDIDEEALPCAAALMASAISGYGGIASQRVE